jgi:hypothetical protein
MGSEWEYLMQKHEGKGQLGRPRLRRDDRIKMDFQEVQCGGTGWIDLAQDRNRWRALVNVIVDVRVP